MHLCLREVSSHSLHAHQTHGVLPGLVLSILMRTESDLQDHIIFFARRTKESGLREERQKLPLTGV